MDKLYPVKKFSWIPAGFQLIPAVPAGELESWRAGLEASWKMAANPVCFQLDCTSDVATSWIRLTFQLDFQLDPADFPAGFPAGSG